MTTGLWSFALLAGALAAFNPCGFAVLPAYLTMIVTGSSDGASSRAAALRRATLFSLGMTLGFVAIFAAFGILFAGANAGLQGDVLPYLPYVTVALGLAVLVLGTLMACGAEPGIPGLRVRGIPPTRAFWSHVGYGASFALASMSCTIGPFLGVVAGALDAGNPVGVVTPFVIYGLGMGTSVLSISLIAAIAGSTVVASIRRRTPVIMRVAGVVMAAAGVYVIVFGLAEILPQFGITALNGFLLTVAHWQGDVSATITSWGTPVLAALAILVFAAAIALWARRKRPTPPPTPPA